MCRPTIIHDTPTNQLEQQQQLQQQQQQQQQQRHVIISGAGPAGLLLTALLLQRNTELGYDHYKITLIDPRSDYSLFTPTELRQDHRSWMLGLAGHGCQALKTCKGLYDEYCKIVGIELDSVSIHLGKKEIQSATTTEQLVTEDNLIVDRNFIVAALARYVADRQQQQQQSQLDNPSTCTTLYKHKLQYVDYERQRVLVRNLKIDDDDAVNDDVDNEFYVQYDLLVGCDGVRSTVREAMIKRHSTFECDIGDIFQTFKAVHVERPPSVRHASMHVLPECFPYMQGIALPETDNKLNISCGIPRHLFDEQLPAELKSDDPKIVANYVRQTFKAFPLKDYDDFAIQWVNQKWNRTGQVHCNFYHSNEINVVLMGDAAHATSPSIGMGMNTALRDAQIFYQLLQEYKDNLTEVLPVYSNRRVKEGNALTDLAMHLYCMDTKQQIYETIHMILRSTLHRFLPFLVEEHPQAMIGLTKYQLSDVYQQAMKVGIISKHRRINHEIRQTYFEETTGMVVTKKCNNMVSFLTSSSFLWIAALSGVVAAAAVYCKM